MPKAIITLNSPEAIITAHPLYGRCANRDAFFLLWRCHSFIQPSFFALCAKIRSAVDAPIAPCGTCASLRACQNFARLLSDLFILGLYKTRDL